MQPSTTLEDLKIEAKKYHDQGIPVVPFTIYWNDKKQRYNKDNHGKWKKWEKEPQSEEEFNNLPWIHYGRVANGFGVICGILAKNGKYFCSIDHDVKAVSNETDEDKKQRLEAIATGKTILKDFPTTQTIKTANNGLHFDYFSRKKVETNGDFHKTTALELLGEKKLCLMPPSLGYKKLNDNPPSEIESLEDTFINIHKKHGFTKKVETDVENKTGDYNFSLTKIVDLSKLNKIGEEYQGSHPIHDSTTEKNFCVNPKTNTWFCFRHNSGGGPLQFLAVKEGIIKCEQAKKGALRGQKFRKVMKIASTQGLVDQNILSQSEINPIILAKDIKEDYIFVVDENTNELYYYNKEIYSPKTEMLLKREIAKRLDENFKNRYYPEICEFIKATVPIIKMDSQNPELLAIKNGVLNVTTLDISAFSPEFYLTSKIDVTHDPKIKYEDSENAKFLKQVVVNPTQRTQIQELIGHTLHKKILTETALVTLGSGGNGKTIFNTTIKNFLGTKNVSSLTIQTICYDKFSLVELKGKLANIGSDLPHKALMNTSNYKAVVSGESVAISIKHVQGKGQTLESYAKFIYSANHLPPISNEEDCYAWYRRFVFADFNVTFTPENATPRQELLEKLSTPEEKSALLNWALEGLQRLIKNGDISNKPSVESIRKEYRKRSLTTLAYFDDCVTITDDRNDYVFTDDWFQHYVTYCLKQSIKPTTKGKFIKDIEEHLSGARKTKIRKKPKTNPLSAYRYVKIKKSVPNVPAVPTLESYEPQQKNLDENFQGKEKGTEYGTSGTNGTELDDPFDVTMAFPNDGKLPKCYSCQKPVYDPNQLTNWQGHFYCKPCLDQVFSQKPKEGSK